MLYRIIVTIDWKLSYFYHKSCVFYVLSFGFGLGPAYIVKNDRVGGSSNARALNHSRPQLKCTSKCILEEEEEVGWEDFFSLPKLFGVQDFFSVILTRESKDCRAYLMSFRAPLFTLEVKGHCCNQSSSTFIQWYSIGLQSFGDELSEFTIAFQVKTFDIPK